MWSMVGRAGQTPLSGLCRSTPRRQPDVLGKGAVAGAGGDRPAPTPWMLDRLDGGEELHRRKPRTKHPARRRKQAAGRKSCQGDSLMCWVRGLSHEKKQEERRKKQHKRSKEREGRSNTKEARREKEETTRKEKNEKYIYTNSRSTASGGPILHNP